LGIFLAKASLAVSSFRPLLPGLEQLLRAANPNVKKDMTAVWNLIHGSAGRLSVRADSTMDRVFRYFRDRAAPYIASMTSDLKTPDGRYHVVQGRLWRAGNPSLPVDAKVRFTRELLNARRAMKVAKLANDEVAIAAARTAISVAQLGLGERGEVWWKDGAPDLNRQMIRNTHYVGWYVMVHASLQPASSE
jgi:hypothetical protein